MPANFAKKNLSSFFPDLSIIAQYIAKKIL